MKNGPCPAKVWEEDVSIPTYGTGEADKNPMFLEKRVYQGSSGRVYPHPVVDRIENGKAPKSYRMAILENEYLRIEIMPELGGRIYRALDKTNGYDFVYYNRVIKPALVGLAGPWISGGIEFNWPQHHRPNTFGPVEYGTAANPDGSAAVWVSEIDRMYGTKMTASFILYPGKAYLEIAAQLYNGTPEPQTFLWWANPAVAVNENTQSIFPPDVTAVFDHGKRDVSRFPIATGTYYKMDYSEGVDISRYKNIPVPTSYMAYKSDYNFVGGYDYGVQAGLLHIADHHISPGKKQWTWGNGEFGQAWDRNLTDEDGPYIELMTGVFTDNQPDFTWLAPYEEKSFKQVFMPYKAVGAVKNATVDAAVNLETDEAAGQATVLVYATSRFEGAVVELKGSRKVYLREEVTLAPENSYKSQVPLGDGDPLHELKVTVTDAAGNVLVEYRPKCPELERLPEAAEPLPAPEELKTNEQLYLAGLHLEQYRHATFDPERYYREGLKRDPGDIRINTAYGVLLLRRGLYKEAEPYFRRAVATATWRNPNPYDSEAYYQLGVALKHQEKLEEAYSAFYKSVWSAAWQDSGYCALAQIACRQGKAAEALEFAERSLLRNARNYQSRLLKAALLRKLGRWDEAAAFAGETIRLDPACFAAHNEQMLTREAQGSLEEANRIRSGLKRLMRGDAHNHIRLAADYADCGLYEEAAEVVLRAVPGDSDPVSESGSGSGSVKGYPMLYYALGFLYGKMGQEEPARRYYRAGREASPDYCFPNTWFDLALLESALAECPKDGSAHYYLGNLLYDKKRPDEAIAHWEAARALDDSFATVHRNLALAYYNKLGAPEQALEALEKAFVCNPKDARVLYELDQLRKKLGTSPDRRFALLGRYRELVETRDDLYVEYVTLLNILERHEEAALALASRVFHPWEGGEGKVTGQYVTAHVELGKRHLQAGDYARAAEYLRKALIYPPNLGEGKLAGAQENHVHYYLGCAHEGLGHEELAQDCFRSASRGLEEPTSAMFYNDQPPDMIFYQGLAWLKLGSRKEAHRRFNKLVDYAERHWFDEVKIDYFAVSLPDFLVFEDDLNKRNRIHCGYMKGLGLIGLDRPEAAAEELDRVLREDPNHQGARFHRNMIG